MTDDTQETGNEQKERQRRYSEIIKAVTRHLDDICEPIPNAQKEADNADFLDKPIEFTPLTRKERKERVKMYHKLKIREYAMQYPLLVRPLIETWHVLRETRLETLYERQLNRVRSEKEQLLKDQNEFRDTIIQKGRERAKLYGTLVDLQEKIERYEFCKRGINLQKIEMDKAIAVKIKGDNIQDVVDHELIPEKCYQMDVQSLKMYKERLETINREAILKLDIIYMTVVKTGRSYKIQKNEIDCLYSKYNLVTTLIEKLADLEKWVMDNESLSAEVMINSIDNLEKKLRDPNFRGFSWYEYVENITNS